MKALFPSFPRTEFNRDRAALLTQASRARPLAPGVDVTPWISAP